MNVFAAMAVLALLIAVHEAGHFLAATLLGMRVSGFSIGFGPALIKRQRRGVTYAIRMLPLGGFVAFPDEDENSSIPADDPDLLPMFEYGTVEMEEGKPWTIKQRDPVPATMLDHCQSEASIFLSPADCPEGRSDPFSLRTIALPQP